ncbi:hypothetical protein BGZ95_001267, partial [Linnemannia exigua]
MDTTSFEDLPYEVQEYVGQYLDQWDLRACVGVSRAWRTLFHSYLWRHVRIVWRSDMRQTNTPTELKTNCHLIHSLGLTCDSWHAPDFFASCPPTFPFLTSLEFKGRFYGGNNEFEELIKRGGGLTAITGGWKKLVFCVKREWEGMYEYGHSFFDTLIQHAAPTVEVLRFEGPSDTNSTDISRLLCSAPNLREFRIDGYLSGYDIVNSDW